MKTIKRILAQGVDLILLVISIFLLVMHFTQAWDVSPVLIIFIGYITNAIVNKVRTAKGIEEGTIILKP
jgi:hypothetical protein